MENNITNFDSNTASVIDIATITVTAMLPLGVISGLGQFRIITELEDLVEPFTGSY